MKKLSVRGFLTLAILTLAVPHAAHAQALTDSAKAGDLEVSDAKMIYKKGNLDVFFSVKNNSKIDEKLGSGDTPIPNSGVVEVVKDKDGKEQEIITMGEVLPAGKSVDFDKDDKWIRIKDVAEPKETDVIPVILSFRRSPNAKLALALNMSKAAKAPTHASTSAAPAPAPTATGTTAPAAPAADSTAAPAKSSSLLYWFKK